eukprot:g5876.t1
MTTKENEKLKEEYLEDKYVDFKIACDEGDPTACYSLGEWYAMVKEDKETAATIFRENCNKRNNGNSCFSLSLMYLRGQGGLKKNETTALSFMEQACKVSHKEGCETAAKMYSLGRGCTKNKKKAVDLRHAGCDLKFAPSCYFLGAAYLAGNRGVSRDLGRAFTYMERACAQGYGAACFNVGVMYENGHGVVMDKTKAKYYRDLTEKIKEERMREMGITVEKP